VPFQTVELPTGSAVVAAIAALAVAAALAVWLIPRRQRQRWERSGLVGKDLAELENSARSTLVQLLGGVALILTFVATWLQISDTRKVSERTLRSSGEQQETERFTRAVEQLGSTKPAVRLGGIYGLQQVARDTPSRRETVAQLMVAYLRSNHRLRKGDRRLQGIELRIRSGISLCASSVAPPWPDTQAALSVLLGLPRVVRSELDLAGVDLVGVRMNGADFSGAILRDASLAGAKLSNANFDHAQIPTGTDLRGACLRGARFNGTYIGLVRAEGADFSGADLTRAEVREEHLVGARTDCARLPWAREVPARCQRP
jgi:hypothetical protein